MSESNWKTWVFVILIMVGLTFELLKHLPGRQATVWDKENLHFTTGQPYSLHDTGVRPSRPQTTHVAADQQAMRDALAQYNVNNKAQQGSFKDKDKDAAKKKKDDDEWEEVIDPVTGKKVRRKKKKKDAKKDEKKAEVAQAPVVPQVPDQQPPADFQNDIGIATTSAARTGQLPPGSGTAGSPIDTLQGWEQRLLNHPDLAETRAFIQDYQEHLVTSEIFYKITQQMISDPRPEMQQLGVMCAGMTPSVESFEILAGAEKTDGATSATGKQASTYLNRYADSLTDLSMMQNILRAADPYSQGVALQLLDQMAKKYLAGGGTTTANPSAQGGSSASQFQPFIPILTQLENGNSQVATEARQTLADIQSLEGGSNVAQARTQIRRRW